MLEKEVERQLSSARLEIEWIKKRLKELEGGSSGPVTRNYYITNKYEGGTGVGGAGRFNARFTIYYTTLNPIAAGTDVADNWRQIEDVPPGSSVTLTRCKVQLKATVNGDIVWDVLKSSDGGNTWNSIFSGDKPTVLDGNRASDVITSFTGGLSNGDLLRLDVVESGSNEAVQGELALAGTTS